MSSSVSSARTVQLTVVIQKPFFRLIMRDYPAFLRVLHAKFDLLSYIKRIQSIVQLVANVVQSCAVWQLINQLPRLIFGCLHGVFLTGL